MVRRELKEGDIKVRQFWVKTHNLIFVLIQELWLTLVLLAIINW